MLRLVWDARGFVCTLSRLELDARCAAEHAFFDERRRAIDESSKRESFCVRTFSADARRQGGPDPPRRRALGRDRALLELVLRFRLRAWRSSTS
mmetsp:Transcript_27961/g.86475  ORF Transcript_27961/g.86475 Transcript_27961/m.86475 type:complete len:94 (-) Transcript_27961:286-567(-)